MRSSLLLYFLISGAFALQGLCQIPEIRLIDLLKICNGRYQEGMKTGIKKLEFGCKRKLGKQKSHPETKKTTKKTAKAMGLKKTNKKPLKTRKDKKTKKSKR